MFLLKTWHKNNNHAQASQIFNLPAVCILFPFIAYVCDDLCQKLETTFHNAEFLEELQLFNRF